MDIQSLLEPRRNPWVYICSQPLGIYIKDRALEASPPPVERNGYVTCNNYGLVYSLFLRYTKKTVFILVHSIKNEQM
jgi:hypothetical protein